MIWRLFRAGEEKGGDETGTLIWTTLVMNFWLSWNPPPHTHTQQIPFFYQEKPSDLSAALRWGAEGSKVLHDVSSLQNNARLIAKESMWWGKVRAVGAVPGVISGLCPLQEYMPSHSAAQAVHWGVLLPLSPWDRLCNACQLPCLVSSSVRKGLFLPTESFWFH